MRAERLIIENDRIFKNVKTELPVFKALGDNFDSYKKWLENENICVPNTKIDYENDTLIFDQELIKGNRSLQYKRITETILNLDYSNFGLDSNPENFLDMDGKIYFIDFYPFLKRDNNLLEYQFDYSPEEVTKRYFNKTNVLATFLIRLYKSDPVEMIQLLKKQKQFLIDEYQEILPREKIRFYEILRIEKKDSPKSCFKDIYEKTKPIEEIESEKNKELLNQLKTI